MKNTKIMASVLAFAVIGSMYGAMVSAENKYVGVKWFNQPDPASASKYWKEQSNGTLECISLGSNGTTTIAYVPDGYTAGADSKGMPKDFDVTVDLVVPDVNEFPDSWTGFYLRASAPQTGTNGYVIHMNSDGLAVFDGESGQAVIEERVKSELFRVNDWNRVRATLIAKELKIWVNGIEAYTYKNCMTGPGYLGLTSINFKGKFRNYKLTADATKKSEAFIVAGTSGAIKPPVATSSAAASSAAVSVAVSSTAASSAAISSEAASSDVSSAAISSEDSSSTSSDAQSAGESEPGNLTAIILIIAAIVVIGGAIAGYLIAKKKRA